MFSCREDILEKNTIDNIFQYIIDDGHIGGIIIADSLEEAMEKLKMRYSHLTGDSAKAIVWSIKDNSHHENDVYEIFNE